MKQDAIALAVPAANRKAVGALLKAGACALALQATIGSALADSTLPGVANVQEFLDIALMENVPAASIPANLHFAPVAFSPEARPVVLKAVQIPPVARPEPKPAVQSASAVAAPEKPTVLFGSLGKSVSLTPVTRRWERALAEFQADDRTSGRSRHSFRAYSAILDKVRDDRRGLQIPQVNYMVNRLLTYRQDARLWKAAEHWASPVEALSRRAGDCEDYAILKYALLRDLGVDDADMRVVVLRDTAARQHHAVLSVRHEGKWLILDNRFSRIRFERDLPNYRVLYSVNASGQWSHIQKGSTPVRLAARLKSSTR